MNTRAAARTRHTPGASDDSRRLPPGSAVTGRHSTSWWAMALLVLTESLVFAALLASYFSLRLNSVVWPPQGVPRPELALPASSTVILVVSSLAMQWGVAGAGRGSNGRLRAGLGVAFVLAAIFLGIQVFEFTRLPFAPQDHAYGSIFWTITGLLALHVVAALLMNLYVQVRGAFGHFGVGRRQALDNAAMYWHFVAIASIFVFLSLFLSPYW